MRLYLLASFVSFCVLNTAVGKLAHLLITSIGDGVVEIGEATSINPIAKSQFLPSNKKLSVRPQSGIETLASGFQFRFGSSTTFLLENKAIELFSGSLFLRSRNFNNSLVVRGPEVLVRISGAGSCLIDVEPNGGFKMVGLLGKIRLLYSERDSVSLLPGELLFTDLKSKNFSDKVMVDLSNLSETSFLVSGFSNSKSFQESLGSVAKSQQLLIGKSFDATVGHAQGGEKFEILQGNQDKMSGKNLGSSSLHKNYQPSKGSPLSELLGRDPIHFAKENSSDIPTSADLETNTNPNTTRPFPSRLLRGN